MVKINYKKRWHKFFILGLLFVILVIVAVFIYVNAVTYQPSPQAHTAFQSDKQVLVTEVNDGYKFEPVIGESKEPNIIFYPGGLVEPVSYSPLARELAKAGHRVYIADMPLNLAIFGQNKADSFLREYPEESFVIGGHSLGGVFAARYALEHKENFKGVFFLASYADEGGSIKDTELSVLQITGSNDAVLNKEKWESLKSNLPTNTTYMTIDGGNHGQFGSYGMQANDNKPTISESIQIERTVKAMEDWFSQMNLTQ
ncbi:alpha/beta fold hydrolase [Litchfieldia salsa]|uniref:Alpha/beta hydrolase family protein n=1 Tax=Litchfieldia salsa TaxID=930152 RepID=A0A1H0PF85_9BACI|nr:alpha/beta fold hydrolase [Litchfieldia salsa]SDP03757.1 Alpha/beta hydrolase family protein [Litchfieldia salsa]